MRSERIVKRQNMKTQFTNLKKLVSGTKAIVQAEQQLRNAYMAGFQAGLKQAFEAQEAEKINPGVPVSGPGQENSDAVPVSHS